MVYAVYYIAWEESERGWGIRPDGYSYHLKWESVKPFIERYWKELPKEVPHCYSRPSFDIPKLVEVSKEFYEEIQKHGNLRTYDKRH